MFRKQSEKEFQSHFNLNKFTSEEQPLHSVFLLDPKRVIQALLIYRVFNVYLLATVIACLCTMV